MRHGFIAGGFKPFTKGHFFLVEKAAELCDKVHLFVSTADRTRKGEMPLYWKDMEKVWKKFLLPIMPSNVEVRFVPNPTIKVFTEIEDLQNTDDEFYIFGDAIDAPKVFSEKALNKYFPKLVEANKIHVKAFDRSSNVNISGTKMREYLKVGDREAFIDNLPLKVQRGGNRIFDILMPKKVTEMKKKITNEQFNRLVEEIFQKQLETDRGSVLRRECFEIVEELKKCLRAGDWKRCKALSRELGSRLEGI